MGPSDSGARHAGTRKNKKALNSRLRDYKIKLKQTFMDTPYDCMVVVYFLYASVVAGWRHVI
ncbi:hypothetical protein Geu3261_0100_008 [Komagataeibacter europaeus NBRC 3261]|uniref:Uncharacterized protein n=1 Tax=Komagataeibacter europaeus NBRC 3261 TaxID=1234669 RepID=A0A0D6Q1Z9_KOMEU|nr:hypothetical protein Geu3261_0100_008 [Komagataeibacter europaeus NBRC 3261]